MIGELKKYNKNEITKINFDELPDDIINLIFKTRYDIMKEEYKKKLMRRYIEDLNWGYTYNDKLNIDVDKNKYEKSDIRRDEWNWVIENFFSYGEQEDQKKFLKRKDITRELGRGEEITTNQYTPDFRLWTAEEIKKFCFYMNLEDNIIDVWENTENFNSYVWEETQDINPYLSARDDDYNYGDAEINICLGNSHRELYKHTEKAIYDALTAAAEEWATDQFKNSGGEGVGDLSRILFHLWGTTNIGSETDLSDCIEETALKLYGYTLEGLGYGDRVSVWGYCFYRWMRYNGISDMNGFDDIKNEIRFFDG